MKLLKAIVSVWEFLDGHKTNIGTFLVTVYTFAVQLGVVNFNADVLTVLAIVFGVGIADKGRKFVRDTM